MALASCSLCAMSSSTPRSAWPSRPDGVEPRREDEADASRGERLALEARRADQRAQPEVLRLGEHLEPVAREDAVLAAQRRDVGDRRERDEIEHAVDDVLVAAQRARDGERELERDADRGEILVLRPAARTLRIEHRVRVRQVAARQVVVADDDVDSRRLQRARRARRALVPQSQVTTTVAPASCAARTPASVRS